MTYQDQISSVELISEHIKEAIQQATDALEAYHNSSQPSPAQNSALNSLHQLNRIFSFIELKGAEQLTKDIFKIVKQFPDTYSEHQAEQLEAVIYGLTLLIRYIDFICTKPFDLPQLLFAPINDVRNAANLPPFIESSLFKANHQKIRDTSAKSEFLDDYEIVKASRRLRQMFQMGLIEIIRKTNVHGGLGMMARALSKLDNQCGSPNSPNLWWIAQGVVEAFLNGGVLVNPTRIKLLARLDLQIRELGQVDHNLRYKTREEADKLTFELLYLVSLSDAKDDLTQEIKAHFELPNYGLTERNLTQEFLLLKGLSEDDYETLFATILDDILKVQTDLIAEEYAADSEEQSQLYQQLKQMHSLFTVLEYKKDEMALKEACERVQLSMNKHVALSDSDRQFASDCLSQIETRLYENRKDKPQGGAQPLQREMLSPEKLQACKSAQKYMHHIIAQLERYSQSDHEPDLLQAVPSTLQRAAEEIQQIDANNIVQLIVELIDVFNRYFVKQPATLEALELLADILVSIEFYLETRGNQHRPSEKIYQFADENLAKLKVYLDLD